MKIKELLKVFKKEKKDDLVQIEAKMAHLQGRINQIEDHLIAIARLSLITPERLLEESKNVVANLEYVQKLIEANQRKK